MTSLAAALLLAFARPAPAESGKTGAILMQVPFGPRPFALGQAYGALGDDVFALGYNPAALSRLTESQAATQLTRSFAEVRMGYVGAATPLDPSQSLGLAVSYLDSGKTSLYDAAGADLGQVSGQKDLLIQTGYAYSLRGLGVGRWHVGASGKVLRSEVFQESEATAFGGDAGLLYERPWRGATASVGLVAANFGPKVKYRGGLASGAQGDPLPATLRAAAAYSLDILKADRISFAVQFDRVLDDRETFAGAGMEFSYHDVCALRVGYRHGQDLANLTFGVGLSYRSFGIDYGIALVESFSQLHQVAATYRFTIPGIRYRRSADRGPTPLETLAKKVQSQIDAERYFDATAELERLESLIPGTTEAVRLRSRIRADLDRIIIRGSSDHKNEYGTGYNHYFAGRWKEAAADLGAEAARFPHDTEVASYLAKARAQLEQLQRQSLLEQQARIGTLFEIAHRSYEAGDAGRSLRIIEEILRLGPYAPAQRLKQRIDEGRAPQVRRKPAAKKKKAPKGAARKRSPTKGERARAESLFYEALRDYADGKLAESIRKLREADRLNPDSEDAKNTLDRIEKEARERSRGRQP